jgi:hypothetical protein
MCLFGRLAHLFDRDRIEIGKEGLAGPAYGRIDDPLKQDRVCGQIFRIAVLSDIAMRTISPTVMCRRSRARVLYVVRLIRPRIGRRDQKSVQETVRDASGRYC